MKKVPVFFAKAFCPIDRAVQWFILCSSDYYRCLNCFMEGRDGQFTMKMHLMSHLEQERRVNAKD